MGKIINYRTDPYSLDAGLFRGNVDQWGRLHWFLGRRILLAGDGERIVALKMEP